MTDSGRFASLIPPTGDSHNQQLVSQFTQLIEESRGSLYAYIFALLPRHDAAEEVFQETALYLWQEFEQFEPGTSFYSWAKAVAFNRIREYRYRQRNDTLVLFEPKLMEELAARQQEMESELDERWQQFSTCMEKLRPEDQRLYHTYYTTRITAEKLAKAESRSVFAIRKSIQKIRRLLFKCVGRHTEIESEK
ncbi:RNA polymerase sigma factor [Polystyrenella longa]|uniref:RNA polymerase sigma factor n=1 Tax=Polystyrenella longa TaxID=2528007 RepID=A0A518CS99_9PLAN|nr:sigma-70 family RNA polymerase sigma factor [Polystyrenella longa]QDU82111.1 RNA polymerase sigma factor [Polystyrenella longa]